MRSESILTEDGWVRVTDAIEESTFVTDMILQGRWEGLEKIEKKAREMIDCGLLDLMRISVYGIRSVSYRLADFYRSKNPFDERMTELLKFEDEIADEHYKAIGKLWDEAMIPTNKIVWTKCKEGKKRGSFDPQVFFIIIDKV